MRDTFKNILTITLPVTIVMFLIVEVFVRVTKENIDLYALTGRGRVVNPMAEWALNDPFSVYRAKPSRIYSDGKTVNSFGFISTPEIPLKKPDNTIRIVFLGGSSTAGVGPHLRDEETWPWITAKYLNEKTSKQIDFINAGVPGYTTFESYGKLWSRLRFFEPDIVVVYHAWNELYYFSDEMISNPIIWRTDSTGFWRVDGKVLNYYARINPHWMDPLLRWSQFLTRIRVKLFYSYKIGQGGEMAAAERAKNTDVGTIYNEKGVEIFKDNILLTKMASELAGAELFVVKQATLITPFTSEADRARCQYQFHGFDHDTHVKAFNDIYRAIEEIVDSAHVIDATPLSGVSAYFYDHVHTSVLGAEKIAEVVAEHLQKTFFNSEHISKPAK